VAQDDAGRVLLSMTGGTPPWPSCRRADAGEPAHRAAASGAGMRRPLIGSGSPHCLILPSRQCSSQHWSRPSRRWWSRRHRSCGCPGCVVDQHGLISAFRIGCRSCWRENR
jgi:hypothetical protein